MTNVPLSMCVDEKYQSSKIIFKGFFKILSNMLELAFQENS